MASNSVAKSGLELSCTKVVVPYNDLNIKLTNIFFPLSKMTGMVWLQINFIVSSQSRQIGSPLTGDAGKMNCFVSYLYWSYTDSLIDLEERSSTTV